MIIDGKALAKNFEEAITRQIKENHLTPKLVIISCDPDDASKVYLRNKTRAAKRVGIICEIKTFDSNITEEQLVDEIYKLNEDEEVHGIIVQLPLPKHIDANYIANTISYVKDVDGFGRYSVFKPCTPLGCIKLVQNQGLKLEGKHCVVIGRSNIVGKPLAKLLLDENATVTVCHSRTPVEQLATLCKNADFIFSSAGVPNLIKPEYLKEGSTLIDISINRDEDGKLCGDAMKGCEDVCGYITPVPGGVGPMTVAMLMMNVLNASWLTLPEDCDIINT